MTERRRVDDDASEFRHAMARTLAASPFSERELRVIFADEVSPAACGNLLASPGGEWAGCNERWLTREILAARSGLLRGVPIEAAIPPDAAAGDRYNPHGMASLDSER